MSLESPVDCPGDDQCRYRYRSISVPVSYYFHGQCPVITALLSPLYLQSLGICYRIGNRSRRVNDHHEFPRRKESLRVLSGLFFILIY